ncbi:MAG: translocation/assembly module TamB domain-containing protein, partial [Burkholderiales bacterium]|nr:translocation/assembly module TamB domain-containing protein [Burkholderiales bacterium]
MNFEPEHPRTKPVEKRRRWRSGTAWLELILFFIGACLCAFVLLASSPAGTRALFTTVQRLTHDGIRVERVEGTLWGHLTLSGIAIDTAQQQIRLDHLDLLWQPAMLLHDELTVDHLTLGHLDITSAPSKTPPTLPSSLRLPVSADLRNATLARLKVNGRIVLDDLSLSATSNGELHLVHLARAGTPWFDAKGELRLHGSQPFRLGGQVELNGQAEDAGWQVNCGLAGQLDDISLIGDGAGGPVDIPPFRADFDVRVNPFAKSLYGLLEAGRIETRAVDLHVLSPHLPRTAIDLSLTATPNGPAVQTSLRMDNALAGAWPAARLPIAHAEGDLLLNADGVRIGHLAVRAAGGQLNLAGTASTGQLGLVAELDKLGLQQFGGPDWPLSGRVQVDGKPRQPHIVGDINAPQLSLKVDTAIDMQSPVRAIYMRRVVVDGGDGQLDLNGWLKLNELRNFQLDAKLSRFDPARFNRLVGKNLPAGLLNGRLQGTGTLSPLMGKGSVSLNDSVLNGERLQGSATGEWRQGRASDMAVDMQFGPNHLVAKGAFGHMGDALKLDFDLPALADLGNGFAGRLGGKLLLAGTFRRPTVDGNATADGLHAPGGVTISHANLFARLDAQLDRPADSPLALKLDVSGLNAPKLHVETGHLVLNGTQAAHGAELSAQGELAGQAFDMSARATGALDKTGWHGRIDKLDNAGNWPLSVNAPARLAIMASGGSLDGLDGTVLGTKVVVTHADWQGARFAAYGDVRDFMVAEWVERVPELKHKITTDLKLSAHFALHGDERLGGNLIVQRDSGDLSLLSDDPQIKTMPLRLSAARIELDLQGDKVSTVLDVKSDAFGTAAGHLTTRFERTEKGWRPAAGAPLEGGLKAEMPSLAWVGPLLGPTASLGGKLSAELTAGGVVGAPQWFGRVKLDDFALRLPDSGVNWREGKLEATLDGENAELAAFSIKGGKGSIGASGRMALRDSGPSGALTVKFDHFGALTRPDRNLILSGETTLAMEGQALTLTGKLTADEGLVELVKSTAPVLGDDVTVRGRPEPVRRISKAPPITLRLDLDLGDRFQFKGQGLDARLSGSIRVTASPTQRIAATGAVKVEEGRYVQYGQNLNISRGIFTFQGPYDNPALDILAERKNLPIEIGVKIVGTALAPRVTLTSDQAMPDSEKLSWLVLGHGSSGASGRADADVLLAA